MRCRERVAGSRHAFPLLFGGNAPSFTLTSNPAPEKTRGTETGPEDGEITPRYRATVAPANPRIADFTKGRHSQVFTQVPHARKPRNLQT